MGRTVSAFLAMEPPTVTHNDLVPCTRGGRPSIRKGERLLDAEAKLMAHMGGLAGQARESGGPLSGALSAAVSLCGADRVDATQENIYERALPYLSAFLKRPPKMESIFDGSRSWLLKKGCPIECVKPGVGRGNKAIYGMRRTPKEKDGK